MINQPLRVLHLEDSDNDQMYVRETLAMEGLECEIHAVKTRSDFERSIRDCQYDLIISDYTLPSFDGSAALALARQICPQVPFVFFSGTIGEDLAVESLKSGAVDYVLKQRPNRLIPAVLRAVKDANDKSRLQRAEERIREQAALLDKASDAIILCDLERHVLFWNQGAEKIYGWAAVEASGRKLEELFSGSTQPSEMQQAISTLNQRGEWSGELEQVTRENRPVTVQSSLTLIRDERGEPKSLLIINTDVTERRQLQDRFLRAQRLESLGVMVSGIAHDLNNALAPALMGTSMLRTQPNAMNAESIIEMVENSTRRGAEMVRQILEFVRGADARKRTFCVDALVKEMGKIIVDVFPKNIHCRTNTEPGTSPITGVPTQVHQVLMNLCVNARDAMPDGGTMTLTCGNVEIDESQLARFPEATPGKYVCIGVADTGCGIGPDLLPKLFEPFFTTKAPGKGTGLGLPTSRNIIRGHGGFMTVDTRPGHGTEFKCYLPAADSAAEPGDASIDPSFLPAGRGECILVVDNESTVLAITKATLENFRYSVITAASGPEAVASFAENRDKVELVLADVSMPFMDGFATALALRRIRGDVLIIMTSGLACGQEEDRRMKEVQAAAFLPKPFTAETLLTLVHDVLTRRATS